VQIDLHHQAMPTHPTLRQELPNKARSGRPGNFIRASLFRVLLSHLKQHQPSNSMPQSARICKYAKLSPDGSIDYLRYDSKSSKYDQQPRRYNTAISMKPHGLGADNGAVQLLFAMHA
jgi:hypothetical protein